MSTRIAVDIMSGDNAPYPMYNASLQAHKELGVDIIMVGSEEVCNKLCPNGLPAGISFVPAQSVIKMDDAPLTVMKEKSDSSMYIAASLVRDGNADALVSAGNTGALFTVSSLLLRRIKGVRRAALSSIVPLGKYFIMLDVGANNDVTPDTLLQFAKMGSEYAESVLKVTNPRVGLLNNGTESTKGTQVYSEAYSLLEKEKAINFVGNIEGREVPFDKCDVLVCDGFVGNITLKLIEGMGLFMSRSIKTIFYKNIITKICGALTRKQTYALKKELDHREYGGAPFLGLAKPVIKAHGSADTYAFFNAIKQAKVFYESKMIDRLCDKFSGGTL